MFFTNLVKLCDFFNIHFTILHVTIHFSSDFILYKMVHQLSKALNLRLFALQKYYNFFNILKFMKQWRISALPYFIRFYVVAAIITMRLLILEILCGDESLISIFNFLCKAIVPVYYSIYPALLLSKKNLPYSLRLIKFSIFCTLRFIILSLRFLFYLAVLYLLSVFLTSNMSFIGIAFLC